jgi:hypothetical protein
MEQLSTVRQYLPTSCGRRQLPPSRRLVSFRICYSSILALLSPKRRRPVHFLVTRQRRSVASVAAIFGHIASRDRFTRQRIFGIEAAPLRSQHRNLTKGLSSHDSLGKGND